MSTERKVYFVFGGPGAGKGTLCTRLAQEMGLAHVCVGDLLRAAIERSDEFEAREQVQRAMKEGKLAPVGAIRTVLEKALQTQSVVLLDGFPRSLEQMSMFEEFFGDVECGLLFSCSSETMERRVRKRHLTCKRIDDDIETVRKRFRQYEEETVPCINKLKEKNKLVEFDCEGDLDEIYEGIKNQFQALLNKVKTDRE
ncbi:hypothetical protein VTN96DRAFT_10299 [Rasamsonia emersonii]